MISISVFDLLAAALAVSLLALLTLAAFYDVAVFRRRKHKNQSIYRCNDCRHIYTTWHRTPLARCPKCDKQNPPIKE